MKYAKVWDQDNIWTPVQKTGWKDETESFKEGLYPLFSAHVSCGLFGISEDHIEKYLSLDERFIRNKASTFFFRADGDSMWPLIYPGDYLIVDRSLEVISNRIIVAFYDGNMVCKRYVKQNEKPFLYSENVQYPPIPLNEETEFTVFGVVRGVVRETL